jgi:hypothetical protein
MIKDFSPQPKRRKEKRNRERRKQTYIQLGFEFLSIKPIGLM